jgi:hypothetical protein
MAKANVTTSSSQQQQINAASQDRYDFSNHFSPSRSAIRSEHVPMILGALVLVALIYRRK